MTSHLIHPLETPISRRALLRAGLGVGAGLLISGLIPRAAFAALAESPIRRIALKNLHTGEACKLVYFEHGTYVPEALATIAKVLRDHSINAQHAIDPALLDLLAVLHGRLETGSHFEVISGYRSPASNASMHDRSSGVAKRSLHMEGKAIDIRVPGRELSQVHHTALAMGLGGVGFYPSSNFVHVDTGRVRQWQGS
jgi:uncharacterized protein YcbK (DUF882 family)